MRIVVQRVSEATVIVNGETLSSIGAGLCILLALRRGDVDNQCARVAEKLLKLRIFDDSHGKMNLSIEDIHGQMLVISQFTLYGDCRKGNRPSFSEAASASEAQRLYEHFVSCLRQSGLVVATGKFQARMKVSLVNDGPVTLVLED